jgi:hypothetical protein
MNTESKTSRMNLRPVSYYQERLTVLFAATVFVFVYFVAYWLVITLAQVITLKPQVITIGMWSIPIDLKLPLFIEIGLTLLIAILFAFGSREKNLVIARFTMWKPGPKKSFVCLLGTTFAFLSLISTPVFLMGGALGSGFSTTLVTMGGLTVIVSNSWKIRLTIAAVCMSSYLFSAFYFSEAQINHLTVHKWLHISSVLLSLVVTLFLSWRGNFSIFDEGSNGATAPASPKVRQEPKLDNNSRLYDHD